jgi:cobalt-zinc-cadmium resistance protein CzcA
LLPDVTFGINNTSIKGTGADDKLYSVSQRFTSAQIGVSVPIFSKAQKNKIKATSFAAQIAENNNTIILQTLQKELNAALIQKQQYEQTVNYIKNNSLPLAMQSIITANKQFENGAINYLEWVQLMHQNIAVQNEFIDAQKNYNDATARIHYLTSK